LALVADPYFTHIEGTWAFARYSADTATGGPWNPALQHGGPPSALLVLIAEALAAEHTGRDDLVSLRLAAEFVRPVPVGELRVSADVLRVARTAVLVGLTMSDSDRVCLHGRVWLVRSADTQALLPPDPGHPVPSEPPTGLPGLEARFPYGESMEWRVVSGGLDQPGPGTVWARATRSILDGVPMTGMQRAALVGDSASGISAELDWTTWSFLNIDLDIHLARPLEGEWVLLDAETQVGPAGSALARSTVSDLVGRVGGSLQTLVLAPREQ
jgi:acyl-coenzyme A thioesterase PaaI-like protein